ncbi:MAG: LA_2272/LA_2273 family lipoprotein [Chitinispirillaceae bacterium]
MKEFILILVLVFSLDAREQIAVIDFAPRGVDTTEAQVLSERLASELFRTDTFTLVEREMMKEILREQGYQNTGCVDESCIVEAGRIIGVRQVVGGSISKLGKTYSVSARLVSVETGKVLESITYDHTGQIDELLPVMRKMARRLAGMDDQEDVADIPADTEPERTVRKSASLFSGLNVPNEQRSGAAPLQVAFISPLALVPPQDDVLGFRWNILLGVNKNLTGLDMGVVNIVSNNMMGLQYGTINFAETCNGLQIGMLNKSDYSDAIMQTGLINIGGGAIGLQVGLINVCEHIRGIQVGLINIIRNGYGPSFCPIINIGGGPKEK